MGKTMRKGNGELVASGAAALLLLASCGSCRQSNPQVTVDMYDGWRLVDRRHTAVAATTFVVTVFDEGDAHVIDDETWTYFEFSVPDSGTQTLPLVIHDVSGTCTIAGFRTPESSPFTGGTFTVLKATPGGFAVTYDLGSGHDRIVGGGVARPIGEKRTRVWPYDLRVPTPSLRERPGQTIKDAWNGAI